MRRRSFLLSLLASAVSKAAILPFKRGIGLFSGPGGGGITQIFSYANFSGSPNLSLGGSAAAIIGNTLWVTEQNQGHVDGGAWYNALLPTGPFSTEFTFQFLAANPTVSTICGGAFGIQNSTSPPGYPGYTGSKMVGDANVTGIGLYNLSGQYNNATPGAFIKFDINNGNNNNWYALGTGSPNTTGLYLNGGPYGSTCPAEDLNPNGIDFYNGNLVQCNIVYDGSLITVVFKDTVTGKQARRTWPLDISKVVGSSAYFGFCSGTVSNEGLAVQSWSLWSGYNPRLAIPTFSPSPGQYASSQSVTISGPSGATIYYTTNGLLPTSSDTAYTAPITVSANEIIQAVAIQSGYTDSLVANGAYQIGTSNHVNFPSGFATGDGVVLCGSAKLSGSAIQLTDTNSTGLEVGAAWWGVPVPIGTFSTTFQIQFTSAVANGMCFVIQNYPSTSSDQGSNQAWKTNGPTVVGGSQSSLGYGAYIGSGDGSPGIPNSVAVKFDFYGASGGANLTGLYTNGAIPGGSGGSNVSPVSLTSGNPINVTLSYDGTTLSLSMTDTVTSQTYSTSFPVDIPSIVGSSDAYVGFTAATGGSVANQFVNNWTM